MAWRAEWSIVRDGLEEAGVDLDLSASGLEMTPLALVEVSDEDAEANTILLERLMENEDVDAAVINTA
eukprot:scaffold1945_cov395-Prasinococcus_capsulatus_cf.AAC.10